jgi:hypothetical protein
MSGSGRVVEIGVISLGTSTQDGTKREVRELKSQSSGTFSRELKSQSFRAEQEIFARGRGGFWIPRNPLTLSYSSVADMFLLDPGSK